LQAIERNVELYPYFRMAADGYAWITVFFLYMSQTLPLDQVILLSSVYYLSVFVLEVPSGYFSDRVGRRTTLLISAAALLLSYSCFIVGGSFSWFAAGQFFLAAGIAMPVDVKERQRVPGIAVEGPLATRRVQIGHSGEPDEFGEAAEP